MSKLNSKALSARRARELAMQIVYQFYARPDDSFDEIYRGFAEDFAADDTALDAAHGIAKGVSENRDSLEELLIENLRGWRPERISIIDKAVIFVALYEAYMKQERTPVAVAIDEAVELVKRYGTDDSGRFVNGVLGNIVRSGSIK